ncbi:hypothetical protein N9Q14_01575 [Pseudomonadales bacterium]|nr:hypothetical protein [Pseudomonadales bacterium]
MLPAIQIRQGFVLATVIYLAIFILIFLSVSPVFGVGLLVLSYCTLAIKSVVKTILFPFYLFPFMFLIRAQSPDNQILAILPDISVVLAIVTHFLICGISRSNLLLFALITSLSAMTFLLNLSHLNDLNYSFLIIRQYVLPLLFLFVVINSGSKDPQLEAEALRISTISFALVALISLLNISSIITVPRSMEALYPFLNYSENTDNITQVSRRVGEGIFFPRLNLFTGGALGSSAAILLVLGLIALFCSEGSKFRILKLSSVPLIIASIGTLSTSIVIALIGCYAAFYFFIKRRSISKVLGITVIFFLLTTVSVVGMSPLDYLLETSLGAFIVYIAGLDLKEVLFGVGPRLTTSGFEFIPNKFIIDVGIFRTFVEIGIFGFCVFAIILLLIFRSGFNASYHNNDTGVRPYLAIFVVFMLSVHANMTALPPFYPLFCAVCLGMIRPSRALSKTSELSSSI